MCVCKCVCVAWGVDQKGEFSGFHKMDIIRGEDSVQSRDLSNWVVAGAHGIERRRTKRKGRNVIRYQKGICGLLLKINRNSKTNAKLSSVCLFVLEAFVVSAS